MKNYIREKILGLLSNRKVQSLMERGIDKLQYFSGIGSGAGVNSSGELVIVRTLQERKAPYLIFDVGANQGQFSGLILENLKDGQFEIHAFEPSRKTHDIYKKNVNDKRVKINNAGLGNANGKLVLYSDKEGSGLASLSKRRLDHININMNLTEEVEIKTLDSYCKENNINKIDLLKIDVEGHELDVLTGAEKMLENTALVSFEFGGCNIDTRSYFQDFYYFFKKKNFTIYRILPSGKLYAINQYKEIYEQFRTTNFLVKNNRSV